MLKVAFGTKDGSTIDQHFGWCRRFDIYEVSAHGAELSESRQLSPAPTEELDKIHSRLDAVADCAILAVVDIGASAADKVVKAKIYPIRVPEDTAVTDILDQLHTALQGPPPPWLRKVIRDHSRTSAHWAPAEKETAL